ncbi:MAG: septation protein SpoVG family protein [Planctomycetota bacterium]
MKNKISEVNFYPVKPTDKGLVGFASLLFDTLHLNSIKVYAKSDGGYRLEFPDKTLPSGKGLDIFYPIDNDTYEAIKDAIAEKIKSVNEKGEKVTP